MFTLKRAIQCMAFGAVLIGMPWSADAQRRYYSVEEVRTRCENAGQNTAIGMAAGAALGYLLGGRRLDSTIIGAGVGGILGYGLSCRQETVFLERVDRQLYGRDWDYRRPYYDRDCRVEVVRSGYSEVYNGKRRVCRTYRSEFRTPNGWQENSSTACFVNGEWRHGYSDTVIVDERYYNSRYRDNYRRRDFDEDRFEAPRSRISIGVGVRISR